jgi:predicted RNase H-like HicB family nuclease
MERVIVEIEYVGGNYCAHAPLLPGCVSTGDTLDEIKKNIKEAIQFHVKSSMEDGESDLIPGIFKGEYSLAYKLSAEALLNAYSDIFTKAALSRITGINERQLWHYAAGVRRPRPQQVQRIANGLHELGRELIEVTL